MSRNRSKTSILVITSTGVAAYNINSSIIHSILFILINNNCFNFNSKRLIRKYNLFDYR